MRSKIYFRGVFRGLILLALIVTGFYLRSLADEAGDGSAGVEKSTQQHLMETYEMLPLNFEANAGQTASQVTFLSRGRGYILFLTKHAETVLVLDKPTRKHNRARPAERSSTVVWPPGEAISPEHKRQLGGRGRVLPILGYRVRQASS
jgi:hypothetical protein